MKLRQLCSPWLVFPYGESRQTAVLGAIERGLVVTPQREVSREPHDPVVKTTVHYGHGERLVKKP